MGNGTSGWVTVLLRPPLFYNPDAAGRRAPVEDDKFRRAYARDVLRQRFRQKAIYLKFVGPVEHLIISEEEVGDED